MAAVDISSAALEATRRNAERNDVGSVVDRPESRPVSRVPLRDHVATSIRRYLRDLNGCDTRNDTLNRDLQQVTYKPGTRDCVVLTGILGGVFAALYLDTGSLLLPVLLHAAVDLRFLLVPSSALPEVLPAPRAAGGATA